MSYLLYDNEGCIRVIKEGQTAFIVKTSIKDITVVREDVIKINTGSCLGSIYIRQQDVSDPVTYTPIHLLTILKYWVSNVPIPGPNP